MKWVVGRVTLQRRVEGKTESFGEDGGLFGWSDQKFEMEMEAGVV